jgi:hypothetical protein
MRPTPRHRVASILLLVLMLAPLAQAVSSIPAAAQQSQPQGGGSQPSAGAQSAPEVHTSTETKTTTWYANPTWIIIGLVVLGLIIVLVSVGRSRTTVIKQ